MSRTQSQIQLYFCKLLLLLLIFIGTGLALSFSVSYSFSIVQGRHINIEGIENNIGIFTLFIKQLIATIIGILGLLYLLKTSTKTLRNISDFIAVLAGLAMILTFIVGPEINGSRRWLVISGISIQTGDFARLALILYLSNIFAQLHKAKFQHNNNNNSAENNVLQRVIIRFMIAVLIYGGSLYLQKDYSSILISVAVIFVIVLVTDLPNSLKFMWVLSCVVLFIFMILSNPNRLIRVLNFLQPTNDLLGAQYQLQKSYEIISSGGLFGNGLGSNMLDILSLPYFNNDFVFSIIIGEFGLFGALVIIMFFWSMVWYAYKISLKLYMIDKYYYYLLIASTVNIIVSAIIHIAVTIGIVPTAGLNLPFYSSGGSAMVTSILSYGFILRAAVALYYHEKNNSLAQAHKIQLFSDILVEKEGSNVSRTF